MMTTGRRSKTQAADNSATAGYEAELWRMAVIEARMFSPERHCNPNKT